MISEPRGLQMFNLKSPPRPIVQCKQTELCSLCVASAFKITFEANVKGYYKERVIKLIFAYTVCSEDKNTKFVTTFERQVILGSKT